MSVRVNAQDTFSISGRVIDERNDQGLEFATVRVLDSDIGAITDSAGHFIIQSIPAGDYRLLVNHVGCKTVKVVVPLQADTIIQVELHHHEQWLNAVVVKDIRALELIGESRTSIVREEILANPGDDLAKMVSQAPGVRLNSTGANITKPLIQGLSNNRLDIFDDGVLLSGQQWGSDHAPETSPLKAEQILVIRGIDGIAYGGNGLGGIISMENGPIASDPELHGQLGYQFASNGLGHRGLFRLHQAYDAFAWRVSGTGAKGGDLRAPDYYLRNTGFEELEGEAQLDYRKDDWYASTSYAYYQTERGILRGAHIGNLTDLASSLSREEPFFTEPDFRYDIEVPRQEVVHHTLSAKLDRNFDFGSFEALYAFQSDRREEFDVRRGNREDRPVLGLGLLSQQFNLTFRRGENEHHEWKTGLRWDYRDNENDPDTGTLPLIPDYESWKAGGFFTLEREKGDIGWSLGSKFELLHYDVLYIPQERPLRFARAEHDYVQWAISGGLHWEQESVQLDWSLGLNQRAPAVNELYSFGLHQGVAAIEEGDLNLEEERSLKTVVDMKWKLSDHLFLATYSFAQVVDGYIYLRAQAQPRLTIRGAFPVFIYTQADAGIYGSDIRLNYRHDRLGTFTLGHDITRGHDLDLDVFLVSMPQDRSRFRWDGRFGESDRSIWNVGVEYAWHWEQTRTDLDAEFAPPPPAYGLLGAEVSYEPRKALKGLRIGLEARNALNTAYRDYLDRLRYFADAAGLDVRVNVGWSF